MASPTQRTLRDLMTRKVQTIDPDATLDEAARLMREQDVGALPVCDGDRILGVITDRDITVRAVAEGQDPKRTKVRLAMSASPIFCFDDEMIGVARDKMKQHQIRRLLVLSRDKRLVGVVSLGDLALEDTTEHAGDVLQQVSMHSGSARA